MTQVAAFEKPVRRPPSRLYHFTCSHGLDGIMTSGSVLPLGMVPGVNLAALPADQQWRADLVWLTDNPNPERLAVGLTSYHLLCDRLAARVEVEVPDSVRWWPSMIRQVGPEARELSLLPGCTPGRWWVSLRPLRVLSFQ